MAAKEGRVSRRREAAASERKRGPGTIVWEFIGKLIIIFADSAGNRKG